MYKIREDKDREKYILLIPAMLDAHFPLMKYAFYSRQYRPIILENEDGITDEGLQYINNDMCYPCILNAGQMIAALKSGKYDIKRTKLLMPTAGDACRGANYLHIIQKAVIDAGFPKVKVVSINLKGLEKGNVIHLNFDMIWRALFSLFYGDILMLLRNHLRPNEKNKGETDRLWEKWISLLSEDFTKGKNLTFKKMKENFVRICEDFSTIELNEERKQRVGIVGELYIKYCHIGNWDMIRFLESQNCESHTNGLSWYAMYYIESHMTESKGIESFVYEKIFKLFSGLQTAMVDTLKQYGFYTMEAFENMRDEAIPYVSHDLKIGDGWLIGSEAVGHILHDCKKVLAVQPFGCMPNHCCGRGIYPHINRMLPDGHIVSIDVDSSGSQANVYNRVRLLVDWN